MQVDLPDDFRGQSGFKERAHLNNNRGNNRRRGRGNNNSNNRPQGGGSNGGGGGGGQQLNRIDSRARGNAPQMLEKYRKLASDAHLNGDRVNAEYYLQFADHYFRVIADTRLRQEEQRSRPAERWQEGGDGGEDDGSDFVDNDFPAFDQPVYTRREREDRPAQDRPAQDRPTQSQTDRNQTERPERNQTERPERTPRPQHEERFQRPDSDGEESAQTDDNGSNEAESAEPSFEPPENPFVRDNRGTRGLRPRREDRRPRRDEEIAGDARDAGPDAGPDSGDESSGFDASLLPPAISAGRDVSVAAESEPQAEAPRRRTRRPRAAPDAGEALATASQD